MFDLSNLKRPFTCRIIYRHGVTIPLVQIFCSRKGTLIFTVTNNTTIYYGLTNDYYKIDCLLFLSLSLIEHYFCYDFMIETIKSIKVIYK